jgi:hypothetical protein
MVADATVIAKINALFQQEARPEAVLAVEMYGEREPVRVQLAMLKNSDGDLDRLLAQAELAEIDYRDVLAMAEYPREMRTPRADVTDEIRRKDRRDYEIWLEGNE